MSTSLTLRKDDFLSEVFGIPWLAIDPPVTADDYDQIAPLLETAPPGAKIDLQLPSAETALAGRLCRDGWYLGSTKLTFQHDATRDQVPEMLWPGIEVSPLPFQHVDTLIHKASGLFTLDRYRNDPYLDQSRVPVLYEKWLSNNISYRCSEILTACTKDDLLGFACIIRKPEWVYCELVGVLGDQGTGIGKLLMRNVVYRYSKEPIRVITQFHNVPMQRVLVETGFKPMEAMFVLTRQTD